MWAFIIFVLSVSFLHHPFLQPPFYHLLTLKAKIIQNNSRSQTYWKLVEIYVNDNKSLLTIYKRPLATLWHSFTPDYHFCPVPVRLFLGKMIPPIAPVCRIYVAVCRICDVRIHLWALCNLPSQTGVEIMPQGVDLKVLRPVLVVKYAMTRSTEWGLSTMIIISGGEISNHINVFSGCGTQLVFK